MRASSRATGGNPVDDATTVSCCSAEIIFSLPYRRLVMMLLFEENSMRRPAWMPLLPLLLLATQSPVLAHDKCGEAECAEVKQKIRTIEAKMRSGYTRAQGERYESRLRELRARRHKACR